MVDQVAVHCMLNVDIIKAEKLKNWLMSLLMYVGAPFTFSFNFFNTELLLQHWTTRTYCYLLVAILSGQS